MRRRGGHRFLLLTVLPGLIAACHRSPQARREEVRREQASWDATAQLTRELRARGALPSVYVRQVEDAVDEGKQQARQGAAEVSQ